jgi:hypothetical protein
MTLSCGVVAMCAAQACAQIGAFSAVLPTLISAWTLTNEHRGRLDQRHLLRGLTLAVPLLSSLTDRVDPKRIYLGSVALTAVAFAGAQGVERPGGGPAAVQGRRRARGGRRRERRALVRTPTT